MALSGVDPQKIVVLGYGFGGDCALELASLDANPDLSLKGAISVYGHFEAHPLKKAKLLILHGFDDVVVPKEEALAFGEQMSKDSVYFQLHLFSQTGHSFMNPQAQTSISNQVNELKS